MTLHPSVVHALCKTAKVDIHELECMVIVIKTSDHKPCEEHDCEGHEMLRVISFPVNDPLAALDLLDCGTRSVEEFIKNMPG